MPTLNNWSRSVRDLIRAYLPRDPRWVRGLWVALIFVVSVTVLATALVPARYELETGQVAPEDITATRTVSDRVATERARREAAAKIPDQYEIDPQIGENAQALIAALFAIIREVNAEPDTTYDQRAAALKGAFSGYAVELGSTAVDAALEAGPEVVDDLEGRLKAVVQHVMHTGVRQEYLTAARDQAVASISGLGLDYGAESLLKSIADVAVVPNMVFNAEETQAKREAAMAAVEPVQVLQGQMIVRNGDVITEDHLAVLEDLGLLADRPAWGAILGLGFIVLLLMGAVAAYLLYFDRDLLASPRRLSLLGLLVLMTILLASVARGFSGFAIPVAAGTMLITILLDVRLAMYMAFIFSPFMALLAGSDVRMGLVALVGGLAGAYAVSRLGARRDLMRAGFVVAGVNVAAILAVDLLVGQGLLEMATFRDLVWGGGNGIFAAVLTIGSLPFLEDAFGVLTPVKLLELANPNQPLLHRLLMEAPGTYHHSILVGNLAEAACNAVGGNATLARVGALYHDVGKARRPYFFIDNQFAAENPHDKIAPGLSALIITSHVRDGVAMAEEAGLPQEVIDLIQQHHGTSLVSYFYSRAVEADPNTSEDDFRYECPRPQTREAAILMLADSCEAAVRSLTRPSPSRIDTVVRKVIRDKLSDNQLEQSPLTLRDLDKIAEVFTRVLAGTFHQRIEYPEPRELRGKNGRSGKNTNGGHSGGGAAANGGYGGNGRPDRTGTPDGGSRNGSAGDPWDGGWR